MRDGMDTHSDSCTVRTVSVQYKTISVLYSQGAVQCRGPFSFYSYLFIL